MKPDDGERYRARKSSFARCLTIYGRKPVLEALQCPDVVCERLHLARNNKAADLLDEIEALARKQGAEVFLHERAELARISRHQREDQGVAADLRWPGYRQLADAMPLTAQAHMTLIAVDGVENPQNLGMLIRSATAGGCSGILLPRSGGCDIGPLVIKASAGSLFRAPILRCDALPAALTQLRQAGWLISILEASGNRSLFDARDDRARVFVLGGESAGISPAVRAIADERITVPMAHGVESLNVAVTAALVAYSSSLGAQRLR
jgi:23S rRNA (guanosine2251-2'-O)-methyltransferase